MKMLFDMDGQIHHFRVTGEIGPEEVGVLRRSILRFLDSTPRFTILDLSESILHVPDFEIQSLLSEIRHQAHARALHLVVAQTDIESGLARQSLLESALEKRFSILKEKIVLREDMKNRIESLREENRKLRSEVAERLENLKTAPSTTGPFHPLLEKLWSGS